MRRDQQKESEGKAGVEWILAWLSPPEVNPPHATLDHLQDFDEIIDVRTPLEYAEDHIPGALSAPVLNNEERVQVGTLYAQASPFEATRLGGALVARNISRHLHTLFADRPQRWKPLVYCWRGGKRSGSMTAWLNLMGWPACQLEGGYRTYRHWVLQQIDALPAGLHCIVLLGPTGTGKTRLLHALYAAGAQILDLEGLARHRGSLLGRLPQQAQPSPKTFQSMLVQALRALDPGRPVFLEAESPRIGRLDLPRALLEAMHAGQCVEVRAPENERLDFLLEDYGKLFEEPRYFKAQLSRLVGLHSKKRVARWHELIDLGARRELFTELIRLHYDPAYARSSHGHYRFLAASRRFDYHPNDENQLGQACALLHALQHVPQPSSS